MTFTMGVGKSGREAVSPWIFIHGTDKVEKGLMVLFFGFFFRYPSWKFSADALDFYTFVLEIQLVTTGKKTVVKMLNK